METYTLLHFVSLVACLLIATRFKSPVSDLVLTRVGYIPDHGMYVCLMRLDEATPDLGLQYTATYTHGHPKRQTSCNGDLTYHGAEVLWYCLPPCPGVEAAHLLYPVSLVVTGHDRTTRDATTALGESLSFAEVDAAVVQAGRGVMEVQWIGRPGRTFKIQLWHQILSAGDESEMDEETTSASGSMDYEISMKIKQCYHESDKFDEDDDDDDNDEDDHEDDNDDFLKWMTWRRCVALHSLRTRVPSTTSPIIVYTSGKISCPTSQCLHYVTDAPTEGFLSAVVMDVTHGIAHSSHTAPTHLKEWTELNVEKVIITYGNAKGDPRLKTMTTIVLFGQQGRDTTSRELLPAGRGLEEEDEIKNDLRALVINGHNHSEVIKTSPGDCRHLWSSGVGGLVCSVKELETLVDPEGLGPVSSLLLLLTSKNTTASTLLAITDVHVRVRQVGPGTVLVLWDRDATVQEFVVSVTPEPRGTYNNSTVICDKRGSDCLVAFHGLQPGRYIVEVGYNRQASVLLQAPFTVEEQAV